MSVVGFDVVPAYTDVSIQSTITARAAAGGGTVILPAGQYLKAGSVWQTLVTPDHIRLLGPLGHRGEWWNSTGKGAVLVNNDNVDTLQGATGPLASLASSIEGVCFESTSQNGAHITLPNSTNAFKIRNCSFQNKNRAVNVPSGSVYDVIVEECFFQNQFQCIAVGSGAGNTFRIRRNYFRAPIAQAVIFNGAGWFGVYIEENTAATMSGVGVAAFDLTTSSHTVLVVDRNYLEGFGQQAWGYYLNGQSILFRGNVIDAGTSTSTGLAFISGSNGIVVEGNHFRNFGYGIASGGSSYLDQANTFAGVAVPRS